MTKEKYRLLALATVCLLLFVPYVYFGRFVDEIDNLVGGMVVNNGGRIYGEFYSQHTPLMYYLTALFGLFGASSVESYRILFYIFLTGCFGSIYLRYAKFFGELPFIVYPLIYIFFLAQSDSVSHTILSEQVQAQAMVVIFLELLLLSSTGELKLNNKIAISISSFVAVGTAFLSIYAVVLAHITIFLNLLQQQMERSAFVKQRVYCLLEEYAYIVFASALPFLLLFGWYLCDNNIENLYLQAYWLNRNVYTKYNGSLGDSFITPAFNALYDFIFFFRTYDLFAEQISWVEFFRLALNKIVFIAFLFLFLSKNKVLFCCISFFVILSAIRGNMGFHAIPYWAISAMMLALVLNKLAIQSTQLGVRQSFLLFTTIAWCCLLILFPYVNQVQKVFGTPQGSLPEKELTYEFYARTLLGKDEGFLATSTQPNQMCYVESHRLPSTKAYTIVPWYTDMFEAEIIEDLNRKKTKLVFHDPDFAVWGWVLKNYAPSLNKYILANYTYLDSRIPGVYIRNEFYEEAMKKLIGINSDFFGVRPGLSTYSPEIPAGELVAGDVLVQTLVAEYDRLRAASILMATYMRKNSSKLEFSILDMNGRKLAHSIVDAGTLEDNKFYNFRFPAIENSGGRRYSIRISAISGAAGSAATAWMSKSDIYPEGELTINGKLAEGGLSVILLYER